MFRRIPSYGTWKIWMQLKFTVLQNHMQTLCNINTAVLSLKCCLKYRLMHCLKFEVLSTVWSNKLLLRWTRTIHKHSWFFEACVSSNTNFRIFMCLWGYVPWQLTTQKAMDQNMIMGFLGTVTNNSGSIHAKSIHPQKHNICALLWQQCIAMVISKLLFDYCGSEFLNSPCSVYW